MTDKQSTDPGRGAGDPRHHAEADLARPAQAAGRGGPGQEAVLAARVQPQHDRVGGLLAVRAAAPACGGARGGVQGDVLGPADLALSRNSPMASRSPSSPGRPRRRGSTAPGRGARLSGRPCRPHGAGVSLRRRDPVAVDVQRPGRLDVATAHDHRGRSSACSVVEGGARSSSAARPPTPPAADDGRVPAGDHLLRRPG